VWLIGAVVYLLAANREFSCSLTPSMDGRIVRCGIISLCQLAATAEIVKALATSSSHRNLCLYQKSQKFNCQKQIDDMDRDINVRGFKLTPRTFSLNRSFQSTARFRIAA